MGSAVSVLRGSVSPVAVRAALRRYRIMAYVVGTGLIILVFVGMPLQYAAGRPEVVSIVGPVHGFLYIAYLVAGADLARRGRWTLWQVMGVVAAGFLPFLAFAVERHVTRRTLSDLAAVTQRPTGPAGDDMAMAPTEP